MRERLTELAAALALAGNRLLTRAAPGPVALALAIVLVNCRPAPPPNVESLAPVPLFDEASARTGLNFEHLNGAVGEFFMPEIMGSGLALIDYDSDGDLDVYFLQGSEFSESGSHSNQLFRNELIPSGELRFVDATAGSGLDHSGYGMGAAVGDYDNDGDPDLFITNFGANALFRNDGDGTFSDVTSSGLDDPRWSASASFFDYDNDGDLDLFFTNYVDFNVRNNKDCFDPTGARDYCTPNVYNPVPDRLFRNDDGSFVDVSQSSGLGAAFGNGLGVTAADFNGDGWTDIYVANDGVANQLWINQGDGFFVDDSLLAGAAYNADGRPEAGMGVTAADFDFDGDEDLFMTHLTQETNTLYLNNGRAQFRDVTNRFGLGSVSMAFTGFGSRWFDFDNDGFLDLFIANGAVTIMESQRAEPRPFRQRNQLFRGTDARFEDLSASLDLEEISRGAASGDIDSDGDVDIVISNNGGPARLLLNRTGTQANWLRVRSRLGARVAVTVGGKQHWGRVHSDGSYLSASEAVAHFGLGAATSVESVKVVLPDGQTRTFDSVAINDTLEAAN